MTTKKTGKATGKTVTKANDGKGRQTVKAAEKQAARPKRQKGTFGCLMGSRKEQVARVAETSGVEAALKKAEALGIKTSSAKGWLGAWRRQGLLVFATAGGARKSENRG